jgi:hypothetical protein
MSSGYLARMFYESPAATTMHETSGLGVLLFSLLLTVDIIWLPRAT